MASAIWFSIPPRRRSRALLGMSTTRVRASGFLPLSRANGCWFRSTRRPERALAFLFSDELELVVAKIRREAAFGTLSPVANSIVVIIEWRVKWADRYCFGCLECR